DRAITFTASSLVLDAKAKQNLTDIAKELEKHPEVTLVEVQGNADEKGDDGFNVELTRSRAAAVVDFLVGRGISRNRVRAAGYGSRCPVDPECQKASAPASCHKPTAMALDRRVAFVVLESGGQQFKGKLVCERGASLIPSEDRKYM